MELTAEYELIYGIELTDRMELAVGISLTGRIGQIENKQARQTGS